METLPVTELCAAERVAKVYCQTAIVLACLGGATMIAVIYDGETLAPVIAMLGGVAGAILGIVGYKKVSA